MAQSSLGSEERFSDWYVWSPDGEHLEAILTDAELAQAKRNGNVTISGGKRVLTAAGAALLEAQS